MSEELSAGCERPVSGPVESQESPAEAKTMEITPPTKETNMIQVGKKAPDFSAAGYHNNAFVNIKLSDHLGKWVVLCFYPGDFTFV